MKAEVFQDGEWIDRELLDKEMIERRNKLDDAQWLAFYIYPEETGTSYYKNDLEEEETVELIFDYCQIGLAIINRKGWDFLLSYYGLEKLYQIDCRSGWNDCDSLEEYRGWVEYYRGMDKE